MNNGYGYGGGSFGSPSWRDFTLDDERAARGRFSRYFLSVFIYLLVGNLAAIALQVAVLLIKGQDAAAIIESPYFIWAAQVLSMYIIALPILWLILRGMRRVFRSRVRMKATDLLVMLLIAEGLMVAGGAVSSVLTSTFSSFTGTDLSNKTSELISKTPFWIIILVAVIIGPIVEELIFRRLLMDRLGIYGDRIAIIVSAISFGLFHGNLFQLVYGAMIGALLAFVYSKTGNVIYTMILHMAVNLMGTVLPLAFSGYAERLLELSKMISQGIEVNYGEYIGLYAAVSVYAFIQYGLAIAGIILLVQKWRRGDFFVSDRCEVFIPKERRLSVIVGNAGAILFIVATVASFLISFLPSAAAATPVIPEQTTPDSGITDGLLAVARALLHR